MWFLFLCLAEYDPPPDPFPGLPPLASLERFSEAPSAWEQRQRWDAWRCWAERVHPALLSRQEQARLEAFACQASRNWEKWDELWDARTRWEEKDKRFMLLRLKLLLTDAEWLDGTMPVLAPESVPPEPTKTQ